MLEAILGPGQPCPTLVSEKQQLNVVINDTWLGYGMCGTFPVELGKDSMVAQGIIQL